jgi:hypothetical protein
MIMRPRQRSLIPVVLDATVRPEEQQARRNAFTAPTKSSKIRSSRSRSERIDSPPMLHEAKVGLCVALKRGATERIKISRAVHESNCGHCRGEVK